MVTRHLTIRIMQYCVSGLVVLVAFLIYAMSSSAAGATQVNKVISGSAVPAPPGVLASPWFAICPDYQHVVYASSMAGFSYTYFSTLIDGTGQPVPVSGEGHDDSYMMLSQIRCTSDRVVYLSDQNDQSTTKLYSAPINGGTYITLSGQLVTDGDVQEFRTSQDGTRAVYQADQETNNVYELYSVPITGGSPISLYHNTLTPYQFISFLISPDGTQVVYGGDIDKVLYSVPIDGGASATLGDKVWVRPFFISPDSARVVYVADRETAEVYELYSVPIAGGTPVKLNAALVSGGDIDQYSLSISSDSARLVYRADQDTDEVWELYSVPITGGIPLKLNGTLVTGGDVEDDFWISPDNARVIYRADQDADDVYELYSVPIGGGVPIKINGALTTGGNVDQYGFWISRDSTWVVYRADQDTDEVHELYRVSITGGTSVKLNSALVTGGDVSRAIISPNNTQVVYRADQDADEVWELYSVPLAGGTVTKVNGPLMTNGDVKDYSISPDDVYVIYRADQRQDERYELYVTFEEFRVYLPVVLRF